MIDVDPLLINQEFRSTRKNTCIRNQSLQLQNDVLLQHHYSASDLYLRSWRAGFAELVWVGYTLWVGAPFMRHERQLLVD